MAGSHHVNYRNIYITLLVLLVVSVVGPMFGIKWLTLITAFGIALVKATLVIQNFMHLKWEKQIVKLTLAASLLLMILFYFAVAPDVMNHEGRNWVNDAALAATERGIEAPHIEVPGGDHRVVWGNAGGGAAAPVTGGEPAAFSAEAAFGTTCASCHGATGAGDGAASAALNPRPADFSTAAFWAGKTDAYLVRVIREGGAAVGRSASMPPWGSLYDETRAQAIVDYIRTLRR